MPTASFIGYGSKFQIKVSGSFVDLAEVISITPPSDAVDVIDATTMDSAAATREYILGLNDPGECSFEMAFIPGSVADGRLQTIRAARAVQECRIVYPNSMTWTFFGILTGYEPTIPIDERMTATVTFKVTGSYVSASAIAPANTLVPAISGEARVGVTLTANEGVWTNAPTFTYQWQVNSGSWANISGATSRTYVPIVGQIGNPLRVQVTGTNAAGNATASSFATANVVAA